MWKVAKLKLLLKVTFKVIAWLAGGKLVDVEITVNNPDLFAFRKMCVQANCYLPFGRSTFDTCGPRLV